MTDRNTRNPAHGSLTQGSRGGVLYQPWTPDMTWYSTKDVKATISHSPKMMATGLAVSPARNS
jgi:hypothetical protein